MNTETKRILVAEDEKPLSKALCLKLRNAGFDVTAALNGQEALENLEKNNYDLILLDLMMPIVDGFQVLTKLKEKKSKIPVIVLSNLGQDEDIKKSRDLGARDFFVKATTPLAKILDIVNKLL